MNFVGVTKTLAENTLFDYFSDEILGLILDDKFNALLTDYTQSDIQTTLAKHLGKITLKIKSAEISSQTLAQKKAQRKQQKTKKMQQQFLADVGLQKLQQAFNAKVDIQSIKMRSNIKTKTPKLND